MRPTLKRLVAGSVLSILLVGCSGQQAPTGDQAAMSVSTIPACAQVGVPVAPPPGFPASFPLPPGMVITSAENKSGQLAVNGVAPGDVQSMAIFFERELPAAMFKQTEGESEPGVEAESAFKGNGYVGRWRARSIGGCPGALSMIVAVGRLP